MVRVMRNGDGPTILLRAEMDALPVEEQTGLDYASTVKRIDPAGNEVYAMHACGHDMHMTVLVGAARVLSSLRDQWKGTLVLIGQPAEEIGQGAKAPGCGVDVARLNIEFEARLDHRLEGRMDGG